jgi:hypothetical protein
MMIIIIILILIGRSPCQKQGASADKLHAKAASPLLDLPDTSTP